MLISTENTFTTPVLRQSATAFDVAVSGTFVGTVTIQLSRDGSTDWIDIGSTTEPTVQSADFNASWFVRAGFKTGDYTSGSAKVEVY